MSNVKKLSNGSVELNMLGLKLEVNPNWLVKEAMPESASKILDYMIENAYKNAIDQFSEWKDGECEKRGIDSLDKTRELYATLFRIDEIQTLADFARHILPLHSDYEMIELSDYQEECVEIAHTFWRYNKLYGHKS